MTDFLTAVKTVRSQPDVELEPALVAVHTKERERSQHEVTEPRKDAQRPTSKTVPVPPVPPAPLAATTPEDALRILRSEPQTDTLITILKQLSTQHGFSKPFDLAAPAPLQAQVVNVLIDTIIPTFWSILEPRNQSLLTDCLSNVFGINAMFSRLRRLCSLTAKQSPAELQILRDLLDVTDHLLRGDHFVNCLQHRLSQAVTTEVKRDLAWKEAVNLLGSGRVVSTVAQAEDSIRKGENTTPGSHRLSNGFEYAGWLGRNIASLVLANVSGPSTIQHQAAAGLMTKALTLGYPMPLMKGLLQISIPSDVRTSARDNSLQRLIAHLPSYAKRQTLEQLMRLLSDVIPDDFDRNKSTIERQDRAVSALAALLVSVLQADATMPPLLNSFLEDPAIISYLSFPARRACVTALAHRAEDDLQPLLERIMITFGDRIFIDHAPVLQQEGLAQTLLLAAGHLHRSTPMAVLMTARSSGHMQGVSNRLDASGQRPRWLGMVVGTALSSLVDKEGSKMSFGTDDMRTEEAKWYLELVRVKDEVGKLEDFQALLQSPAKTVQRKPKRLSPPKEEAPRMLNGKPVYGPPRPPQPSQTEVVGEKVTEILDDVSDEDDDLQPYAKPDSDPEDSDEDATLVNRTKARPPVYIRNLMTMLRDDKDHDRLQLGIRHAAPLIRRKANFGAEVKDHAEELMRLLCNLQDPFETEDFDDSRLQALIAVLLSDVETLSPWLIRQAFAGEYSIAQRCLMLSALGLGGRELAGFKDEDNNFNPALSGTHFPSKRLPPHLHAIYASDESSTKRLESASKSLEHHLIKPMALQAADQSTAHLNSVKVRTFSSRMDVERTKRKPAANQLAKILGPAFFFPLISRYQQEIAAYGSSSVFASAPFVLVTFLKTLALLLHASGPATLNLPGVTAEFWELLLSLRVRAISDISILEAVLFSLLTLLEVNTDKRRIAEEQPKHLMETQQWVELVFDQKGGGESMGEGRDEEAKVRTLAAGVLVKTREVVEAYQKQLFGRVLE